MLVIRVGISFSISIIISFIFLPILLADGVVDVLKGPHAEDAKTINLKMNYRVSAPDKTYRARFVLLLPSTLPYRQKVISKKWIVPPTKIHKRGDSTYAEWILDRPKGEIDVGCELKIELYPFDYSGLSRDVGYKADYLKDYLMPEKYLETRSQPIMDLAKKVAPANESGGILLHSLFNGTLNNLDRFKFANEAKGAKGALKLGGGDCTDFTDVLVSLSRVRKLPARHVHGILAASFNDTPKHSWAEVYVPQNGWVRLDPFLAKLKKASFRNLKNYYITLTYDRNNGIYSKKNGISYWRYWSWGDPIAVTERLDCGFGVFKERVSSIRGE